MFMKLTQISMLGGIEKTNPVYVNTDNITWFGAFEQPYYITRAQDDVSSSVNDLKRFHTVTSISFTAGLHEESESINVKETPEEIMDRGIS